MVVFGYLDAARDIHFGERGASQVRKQRISCSCKTWQTMIGRHGRSSAVHWCVHICFVLKEAGFSPGHAFYIQAGFTVLEVEYILDGEGQEHTSYIGSWCGWHWVATGRVDASSWYWSPCLVCRGNECPARVCHPKCSGKGTGQNRQTTGVGKRCSKGGGLGETAGKWQMA